MDRLFKLARKHLSDKGYEILMTILKDVTPVWERKASSSGKYHQKDGGYVPTIAEHTYEMLLALTKVIRLFDKADHDILIMGVVLHDCLKYGKEPGVRTAKEHDALAGELVTAHKDALEPHLTLEGFWKLRGSVKYHSGRWTPNNKIGAEIFKGRLLAFAVHLLDMLSAGDCLKGDKQ